MRSSEYKYRARQALCGNWLIAIIAAIIAGLLGASVINTFSSSIDLNFSDSDISDSEINEELSTVLPEGADPEISEKMLVFIGSIILVATIVGLIYALIMFTVGSAVSVGYARFNLDMIDGITPRIGTMFSAFGQIKTAIAVRLVTSVLVSLGYLLLIVPGIILNLNYSMAIFVMSDNPYMTTREVLAESRRIMTGRRWRFFCLEFSFIGLIFLCMLTLGIGFIWLVPYMNATYAAFYRQAKMEADYTV